MFKKLLNVGKGHSASDKAQYLQQQKSLFQLNEIKTYGFSHLCCLAYSPQLSLLAVGSKSGLLRVLGQASVEFSHQLESGPAIRQIEFIDCRNPSKLQPQQQQTNTTEVPAKIVVLTDNGQLYLLELRTICQQALADSTTQTETDCCRPQSVDQQQQQQQQSQQQQQTSNAPAPKFTKLQLVAQLEYFKCKPDNEDRSKRVTTLEVSADDQSVFVGTEGGNVYLIPLEKFEPIDKVQPTPLVVGKSLSQQIIGDEAAAQQAEGNVASSTQHPQSSAGQEDGQPSAQDDDAIRTSLNLNDEPLFDAGLAEQFEMIKFDDDIVVQLGDDIKSKKQGAIESIKRHPASASKLLLSYHRGLNVIYDFQSKSLENYFYHNQVLESSCFADQSGDIFYTSHNDGSYIKWDVRQGSQSKANEDFLSQLYGPYPCKPTPKIQACTGLLNDQLEDLIIFSGGMPRATYDDKNPVTIVKADADGKDKIKVVLDFTSKVLDFAVITRPRGNLGPGAKSSNNPVVGGGKKSKHKQQQQQLQQQQQRDKPIAVALAILAEEEFVVIDLLNSESYMEFALPYLNCVHSSAITCNHHFADVGEKLYEQLLDYSKQLKGKLSPNEWPITGGKVIEAPELNSCDILLTGHEDGSVNFWDVSNLKMSHLFHISTAKYFVTNDDELPPIGGDTINETDDSGTAKTSDASMTNGNNFNDSNQDSSSTWPPLKRVGRFDPYSDDARLAIKRLSLCPKTGTLVIAGTGGQVIVLKLKEEPSELSSFMADSVTIVNDQRFTWKGHDKMSVRPGTIKQEPGYQVVSYLQLDPPAAATALDLHSDWNLYAIGTSYGFVLYDYVDKHSVLTRCTLNVQDFAIVGGDAAGAGAMSRKKSFRKSLRESFRRLRRGRSQRNQAPVVTGVVATIPADQMNASGSVAPRMGAFNRPTTGVRALNSPSSGSNAVGVDVGSAVQQRNIYSTERQVEQKVELSSIVKCITLTSAMVPHQTSIKPTLWVGTNSGLVILYAIDLATRGQAVAEASSSGQDSESPAPEQAASSSDQETAIVSGSQTSAIFVKEIQLMHRAPIIGIFTNPSEPVSHEALRQQAGDNAKSSPEKPFPTELLSGSAEQSRVSANESGASEPERNQTPVPQTSGDEKVANKHKLGTSSQPRVLICSEEQFKVFNLPNLKPFCKFKLTAHEGIRAKKISITTFLKPPTVWPSGRQISANMALSSSKSLQSFATQTSPPASPLPTSQSQDVVGELGESAIDDSLSATNGHKQATTESNNNSPSTLNHMRRQQELMNAKFGTKTASHSTAANASDADQTVPDVAGGQSELFLVCMSNQGDCAIYSVPDLKRQAQIQVCKREDINGITSAMLTNYGEGYYLRSSSNFLRFSISAQRVPRVLSLV